MIEKIIIKHLNDKLNVPAYMEEPAVVPDRYVIAEKTAESITNRLGYCTIAVKSYGTSLLDAAEINEQVKSALLWELPEHVTSCKLNSSYNFTDPRTKRHRYQAVFNIAFYIGE